jgi:hypothetical protein
VAFVRKKQVGGREYYQLVESHRVEGKPRQKVLMHLGHHRAVDEALKRWPREISALHRTGRDQAADALKEKLDRLRHLRTDGIV